jgi:hypothetical protein
MVCASGAPEGCRICSLFGQVNWTKVEPNTSGPSRTFLRKGPALEKAMADCVFALPGRSNPAAPRVAPSERQFVAPPLDP